MPLRPALLTVIALALGLALPADARAAEMLSGVQETALPQDQCLSTAAERLRSIGFTRVNTTRTSTFAFRGDDGVTVRCLADKGIAVIFIYAKDGTEAGRGLLEQLHSAYRGGTAPGGAGNRPGGNAGGGKF